MAKEYQMLFQLGAKLGQNFSGTFSSAQKVLQQTQKEIQTLNRAQSDITAYQRAQQSIEKTSARLTDYKDKLANVEKEISRSGEYSSKLAEQQSELKRKIDESAASLGSDNTKLEEYRKKLADVEKEISQNAAYSAKLSNQQVDLKRKIDETTASVTQKNSKLAEMREKLSDAGVDVKNLTNESDKLKNKIADLRDQEELAALETKNLSDNTVSATDSISSALIDAGILTALGKLASEYKACVDAAKEFGYTMSTVEALSGASEAEMRELTAEAKEMSATTAFTANQSAQAMTYMGMAGWDAQQMMSGMDGVLDLAAASGEDLASVSDIVTDNLTAFRLKAEDTAHFSDVLAAAATNSNTSVGIMGETFKGSASVAGALGYSIEDVAVAVGLMANAGVKGSIANTALKNTFNGLLTGATLTSKSFGEIEYTAVNADGTMKDFSDTIDELRGYFNQMTESERVNNAMTIAGQYGYNGLLAILNSTDEDYQKLSDSINNCSGAAQRMANIKLDNLQGDITLLNSAADGLKMTIGGMYNKEFRALSKAGTAILSWLNTAAEKCPILVKSLIAMTAELGAVLGIYTAFNAVKKIKNALSVAGAAATAAETAATTAQTTAQIGLNAAMDANPIGVIIGLVGALTVGITALVELENKHKEQIENSLIPSSQKQADELELLKTRYEDMRVKYGENSEQAERLKYKIDELSVSFENSKMTVKEFYDSCDETIAKSDEVINTYHETISAADDESASTMALIRHLQDLNAISNKTAQNEEQMRAVFKRLKNDLPDLDIEFEDLTKNSDSFVESMRAAAKQKADDKKYLASQEAYADALVQQEDLTKKLADAEKNLAQYKTQGGFGGITYTDIDAASDAAAYLEDLQNQFDENQAAIAEIDAMWGDMAAAAQESGGEQVTVYEAMETAIGNVADQTENLLTAYNEMYQAAYNSVNGQFALWDQAAEVSAISVDTVNANLEGQAKYWSDYNSNIETLLGKADGIDGLRDVIASFSDGSAESVNMIAGMVAALTSGSDDDLKKMVENWKEVQEEQKKTAEALADTKLDFEQQMNDIQSTVADAVEKMNMEDSAKAAAQATIQAYADAIVQGKTAVTDAAESVKNALEGALNGSPILKDFIIGEHFTHRQQKLDTGFNAYASGTDYAQSGYALVGENGPELVRFSGGEEVYTANETKAVLGQHPLSSRYSRDSGNTGSGQVTITISPNFTINGNADKETLDYAANKIVEMVKDALRNEQIDIRRGAYV